MNWFVGFLISISSYIHNYCNWNTLLFLIMTFRLELMHCYNILYYMLWRKPQKIILVECSFFFVYIELHCFIKHEFVTVSVSRQLPYLLSSISGSVILVLVMWLCTPLLPFHVGPCQQHKIHPYKENCEIVIVIFLGLNFHGLDIFPRFMGINFVDLLKILMDVCFINC